LADRLRGQSLRPAADSGSRDAARVRRPRGRVEPGDLAVEPDLLLRRRVSGVARQCADRRALVPVDRAGRDRRRARAGGRALSDGRTDPRGPARTGRRALGARGRARPLRRPPAPAGREAVGVISPRPLARHAVASRTESLRRGRRTTEPRQGTEIPMRISILPSVAAAAAIAFIATVAGAAPDSAPEEALADYVAAPDESYSWRVHARHARGGAEIVELRLHSQTWRGTLWKHQLYVIKPSAAAARAEQGLFVIGGGRWRDEYDAAEPGALPDRAELFLRMAQHLDTIVAVLGQVP